MPKPITAALLANLFTGFKTSFQGGFAGVSPLWSRIATRVPSSTREERYGWLGQWPRIREWIGDRVVNELAASTYSITNKRFETTVGVKRDDIADDNLGIYGPMFQELGRATAIFPDEQIFALLAIAHLTKCFDGQYFFDTDHPVGEGTASNDMGGAGTPWFLMDVSRSLKPLIYQDREPFDFVPLDKPDDPNVFMKGQFIYGSTGRMNVGLGFWQMAIRSAQPLTADNYAAARAAMIALTDDVDRPLGLNPNLLVVPGSLEGAARGIVKSELVGGGNTNPWAGTADLMVAPLLA